MDETKTLTLPVSKKTVIIRGFVTGQIDREVKKISAQANKISFNVSMDGMTEEQIKSLDGGNFPPGTKMNLAQDPTKTQDADDKLLELMVSAIDGDTGDVFNKLMSLPAADVQYVLDAVKQTQSASNVEGADPKAPAA